MPRPEGRGGVYEYNHSTGGCSVTGGYVYRGSAIPALDGAYVFADYCTGVMTALVQRNGKVVGKKVLSTKLQSVASFGEDQNGELYVLLLSGTVLRIAPG